MRLTIIIVIVFAIAGAVGYFALRDAAGDTSAPSAAAEPLPKVKRTPPLREDPKMTVVAPAVVPAETPSTPPGSYRSLLAAEHAWLEREMLTVSREANAGKPWIEDCNTWISAAWRHVRCEPWCSDAATLVAASRPLLKAGCDDGAFLALLGLVHPEHPVSQSHLYAALPRLRKGHWTPLLTAMVQQRLSQNDEPADPVKCALCLEALAASVAAGECANDSGAAVLLGLLADWDAFRRTYACTIANRLAGDQNLAAWARATLIGVQETELAWRSRGSGYANTVTEEGWRGFHEHLELSAAALEIAHQQAPHRPEPLRAQITVAMGQGDDFAKRLGEILKQAEITCRDDQPTWNNVLYALLPRWHGSLDVLAGIALQRADDTDYSGYGPLVAITACTQIDSECDWNGRIYRHPKISAALARVCAGYLAEAKQPFDLCRLQSEAFRIAFLGERYQDAARLLETLDRSLSPEVAGDRRLRTLHLAGMCAAAQLELGEPLRQVLRDREDLPEAETLDTWLAQPETLPVEARLWFEHLRICRQGRERALPGATLALPALDGVLGWEPDRGVWRADHGAFVVDAGFEGHRLMWQATVGPAFTVRGKVSIVQTSNGTWQAGVVFGRPSGDISHAHGWGSVRFRPHADGVSAEISCGYSSASASAAVPVKNPQAFTFLVSVHDHLCSASIDGQPVLVDEPIPAATRLDANSRIGLGAYMNDNDVTLRYESIEVEVLDAKPAKKPAKAEANSVTPP